MCGISGLLSPHPINPQWLAAMTAAVRHRGPDDEGYVLFTDSGPLALAGGDTPAAVRVSPAPYAPRDGSLGHAHGRAHVAFGHRRLSIVDLSPLGHQPMCFGGRYWITYSGEVYNHAELAALLNAEGCRFRPTPIPKSSSPPTANGDWMRTSMRRPPSSVKPSTVSKLSSSARP